MAADCPFADLCGGSPGKPSIGDGKCDASLYERPAVFVNRYGREQRLELPVQGVTCD